MNKCIPTSRTCRMQSMGRLWVLKISAVAVAALLQSPASRAQTPAVQGNPVASVQTAKPASAYSSGVVYDWFFLSFQLIQQTWLQPSSGCTRLGIHGAHAV
jgi:hypothetical protein